MDFKNMTDAELAKVMVDLISRIVQLEKQLVEYLDNGNRTKEMATTIKTSYKHLKRELQEYYHYVSLRKNESGTLLYKAYFVPAIREAYAKGFNSPANSKIDSQMLYSVMDGVYYLKYYISWLDNENSTT